MGYFAIFSIYIVCHNPFQELDVDGVGMLIEWAVKQGRSIKPTLKAGICGEHGGDKKSIYFCHAAGLNYVSCSPFRIPLARIAAAQAKLFHEEITKKTEVGSEAVGI